MRQLFARIHLPFVVAMIALLTQLIVATPSATLAADAWVDTRSVGPFVCQATFPLAECDPLLVELPELQRELTRTLGVPAARNPIGIYLFSNAAQHQAYIEQHFPNVPYRRALFVKEGDQAGVYAYRHVELDVDLRHECTHALLHGVLPVVPLWLDEGLAEYFEVPAAQRAFDHPHYEALRWNLRLGMVQNIESLENRTELAEMGSFDYRYSWAWVHFMLHGPKAAHRTLVTYLANIQNGAPPGRLSEQLAKAVPDPTERMIQHFKHWRD
ncbi:MAG: hypothetical protein WD468_06820 [Pirellulales bacterium]